MQYIHETQKPAPVLDAATIILLRDSPPGPEAFTMTRATSMAFSAGATVFPGGKVDPGDDVPAQFFAGTDIAFWQEALGSSLPEARSLLVAAIRETFEESGILFARPACGGSLADPREFEEERARIEAHELSFSEFLAKFRLVPDFSLLRPWSRWVTPVGEPRRYDTRFLLAALPSGQEAILTTGEATSVSWMTPDRAMNLFRDGATYLMPPTWAQFQRLQGFDSVASALSAAPEIAPIEPELVAGSDPLRVRFPSDEHYYALSPVHRGQ